MVRAASGSELVSPQPCRLNNHPNAHGQPTSRSELGRIDVVDARNVTRAGNDATIPALDHGVRLPHR